MSGEPDTTQDDSQLEEYRHSQGTCRYDTSINSEFVFLCETKNSIVNSQISGNKKID